MTPPTAEGGALRSQDVRTTSDPVGLDGAILRVDPATGAGLPDNPMASSSDPNARRIVAYGLRNPFRITTRPGTNEVWIGDVGWNDWEEIDRLVSPTAAPVDNFGWPCYEGDGRQGGYDAANLSVCENLYAAGHRRGRGALLPVPPQRSRAAQRRLPEGRLVGRGHLVRLRQRRLVPGRVPRRAVLRRLLPPVHLGDPDRRRRAARHLQAPHVRRRRRTARRPRRSDRAAISSTSTSAARSAASATSPRTSPRSPSRPPTPTSGAAPLTVAFDGRASSDPDGDALDLRLGPRRRRRVRRRHRGDRQLHLRPARRAHRHAPRHRPVGGERHGVGPDLGGQHAARPPSSTRRRPAPRGRSATSSRSRATPPTRSRARSGVRAHVVARAPALSLDLPRAPAPDVRGHGERQLRRPGPRVPVAPGAAADGDRLRRPDQHDERPARPADRRPHLRLDTRRPHAGGRIDQPDDALHPHRDPRLDALGQRAVAAGDRRDHLRVRRLVGRRRPDPHHRGQRAGGPTPRPTRYDRAVRSSRSSPPDRPRAG